MTLVDRLRSIADALPVDAAVTLPVATVRAWLNDTTATTLTPLQPVALPQTWRERLWECPAETRLGVHEVAEALDRSPDWVYRTVSAKRAAGHGRDPLPCSRLDGVLVFTAGAVRQWVQVSAVIVNPEPRSVHLTPHTRTRKGAA